jgi:hypothetical protein
MRLSGGVPIWLRGLLDGIGRENDPRSRAARLEKTQQPFAAQALERADRDASLGRQLGNREVTSCGLPEDRVLAIGAGDARRS